MPCLGSGCAVEFVGVDAVAGCGRHSDSLQQDFVRRERCWVGFLRGF